MANYWWSVFWEGVGASIEAIGQPLQVLLYSLLILILGWLFLIRKSGWKDGWKTVKQNIAKTFGEVVLIGIVAWIPFLLFHVCRASYLRWKGANTDAVVARAETKNLKQQLDELTQPKLNAEIDNIVYGPFPGTNNKDTILMVIASIKNTGAPTVIDHIGLAIKIGDVTTAAVPVLPGRGYDTYMGHGHKVMISSSDYLPRKAISQPIPHGGELAGFMQGVLQNVNEKDFRKTGTLILLKFIDVNGKKYQIESPLGTDLKFVDSVGIPKRP